MQGKKNIIINAMPYTIALSFIVGIFMVYVAWQHNSQGEIHDNGYVDIGYVMMIFMSWFGVSALITVIILLFIYSIRVLLIKLKKGQNMKNVVLVLSVAVLFIGGCGQKPDKQNATEIAGADSSVNGGDINEATADDNLNTYINNIFELSLSDSLVLSSRGSINDSKKFPIWTAENLSEWATMSDTILSLLRQTLNDDADIASIHAIMKNEIETIENNYDFTGEMSVAFGIEHKDDNYITARFFGDIFCSGCAYPSIILWPVMVNIKNKRKITLSDIVKIDDMLIELIFKKLVEEFREIGDDGDNIDDVLKATNNYYPKEGLKDVLLKADVFEEYTPNVRSYFTTDKLTICFDVGKAWGQFMCVWLPIRQK